MATIVKHAIRTTEGWNSMSSAEQAQYTGYYTTLSAWRTARFAANPNLVTADVVEVAECFNDWPNGLNDAVNLNGFTVDSTRYIKITVAQGHRHIGIPRSGFFMYTSADFSSTIRSDTLQHTRVEYMDLRNNSTSTDATAISLTTSGLASNCLLTCKSSRAIASIGGDTTKIVNTLFYNGARGVTGGTYPGGVLYNCVFYNLSVCAVGASSTLGYGYKVVNCVALNAPSGVTGGEIYYKTGTQNNYTSGTTDVCFTKSGTVEADFIDPIGLDLHSAQYSRLHRMGINLYSDGIIEDIDGNPLPATGPWDIGINYKQPDITRAKPRRSWLMGTGTNPPVANIFRKYVDRNDSLFSIRNSNNLRKAVINASKKVLDVGTKGSVYFNTKLNTIYTLSNNSIDNVYNISGVLSDLNFSINTNKYILISGVLSLPSGEITKIRLTDTGAGKGLEIIISYFTPNVIEFQIKDFLSGTAVSNIGSINTQGNDNIPFYLQIYSIHQSIPTFIAANIEALDKYDKNKRIGQAVVSIYSSNGVLINNIDTLRFDKNIVYAEIWSSKLNRVDTIHECPINRLPIVTRAKTQDSYPVTRTVSSPAPSLILSKKAAKQPQGPVILNRAFAEKAEIVFTGNRCKTTYGVYADNLVETGPILESRGTVISTVGVAGQAIGPNTIGGSGFTFTNTPGTAGLVSSGLIVIEFPNTIMDGGSLYNNCWSAADFPDDPGLSVTCFNTGTILFELQNTGEQIYSLNGLVAKGLNIITWSYDGNKFIANINNKSGGITSVYQPFNTVRPIGAFGDYYDLGTTYGAGAKKYYLGAIWSRAMSTSELYQLHQNPWQILQPVNRRIITGV